MTQKEKKKALENPDSNVYDDELTDKRDACVKREEERSTAEKNTKTAAREISQLQTEFKHSKKNLKKEANKLLSLIKKLKFKGVYRDQENPGLSNDLLNLINGLSEGSASKNRYIQAAAGRRGRDKLRRAAGKLAVTQEGTSGFRARRNALPGV